MTTKDANMLPQDEKTVNKFDELLSLLHRTRKQSIEEIALLRDYVEQLNAHISELESQQEAGECPLCGGRMKDVSEVVKSNLIIRHPFGAYHLQDRLSQEISLAATGLVCSKCGLFETQLIDDIKGKWDRSSPGSSSSLANLIFRNCQNVEKVYQIYIGYMANYALRINGTWYSFGEITKDQIIEVLDIKINRRTSKNGNIKPEQKRSGYVYLLLGLTENRPYKIGRSKTPEQRTEWIGLKVPFETEVCHIFHADDMYLAESELHNRFSDRRQEGEWFNLTDGDVQYITSISEYKDEQFISNEAVNGKK